MDRRSFLKTLFGVVAGTAALSLGGGVMAAPVAPAASFPADMPDAPDRRSEGPDLVENVQYYYRRRRRRWRRRHWWGYRRRRRWWRRGWRRRRYYY